MGAAFHCHAQDNDDFESFRSGLMDGFQSFRQEVLSGYTDFLRTAWEDFNVFRSESRDSKPKPRTAPTVDSPSPQPTTPEPPANHPTPAATPPAPSPAPAVHNNITLDFYGTRLMLPALKVAALHSSDNNGVADFWQALDSQGLGSKTGNALKEIAERHRFNDWMMLKLVETYVANQLSTHLPTRAPPCANICYATQATMCAWLKTTGVWPYLCHIPPPSTAAVTLMLTGSGSRWFSTQSRDAPQPAEACAPTVCRASATREV